MNAQPHSAQTLAQRRILSARVRQHYQAMAEEARVDARARWIKQLRGHVGPAWPLFMFLGGIIVGLDAQIILRWIAG